MKKIFTIIMLMLISVLAFAQAERLASEGYQYYEKGDYANAFKCFKSSAEQGSKYGQHWLAACYFNGQGVARDFDMAAYWYHKAALQGDAQAQANEGLCHSVKDWCKAVECFQKASDMGNAGGQKRLAECYYYGRCVSKDFDKARHYLRLCLDQGPDEEAENLLRELGGSINNKSLPTLTWHSATGSVQSRNYSLFVSAKSSSKIKEYSVLLNGSKVRGLVVNTTTDSDLDIKENLTLANGDNIIEVIVINAGGTANISRTISFNNNQPGPINQTKRRVALVIGNSEYQHASKLPNPKNDATDISAKLRTLGFDVMEKHDISKREFDEALATFARKAATSDAALLYYAGHGIENDGVNYLIPVDAKLEFKADLEYQCVRADRALALLEESGSKMNIIVLDACRNNPLNRGWARGDNWGLGGMSAPTGSVLAFSTSPKHTADDGYGRNSPYTKAFLECLNEKNLPIELFLKKVGSKVSSSTNNRQTPWMQSALYGDFYFNY